MALVTVGNLALDVVDVRGHTVQPVIDYFQAPSGLFPEIEHVLGKAVDFGIEASKGRFEKLAQPFNVGVDAVEPFVGGHFPSNITLL
jgi:hypothetical protein